jgi:hypothetical protein
VLRTARLALLKTLGALGLDDAAPLTRWRRHRVLILGYHGISLDDEHHWDRSSTCRHRCFAGASS